MSVETRKPIGIIAAMQREIDAMFQKMEHPEKESVSGIDFVKGTLCGTPVVMVICGPGKVAAGICAEAMILRYAPRLIIKTGVAGSLSEEIGIGGIVVGTYGVQHDIDTTAVGDPLGLVSKINKVYFDCDEESSSSIYASAEKLGYKAIRGGVATGDQFICRVADKKRITENFKAVACEMEGAAVLQAGFVNETPVALLLAISDEANGQSTEDYAAFTVQAASHNVAVLLDFLAQQ